MLAPHAKWRRRIVPGLDTQTLDPERGLLTLQPK